MFTYAVLSEVGEREINEDSVGFAPVGKDIGMVILADGLGGHGRGEDASALVTTASKEVFRYYYNQKDCLERCFMESQKRLMKKQADENARQDLKTTLVLLRIVNGYVQWGHVGDSRLYYFKNGKIGKDKNGKDCCLYSRNRRCSHCRGSGTDGRIFRSRS